MSNEFAERFAALRQERGLTQQRLADRLGVTAQAVSKYETGASLPDVQTLKSLAVILGCTTDYLLGHELAQESMVDMVDRQRREEIDRALQKECLAMYVGPGVLVDMLMEENNNRYAKFHELRVHLAAQYGILVPVIRLMDSAELADKEYEIRLYGRTVAGKGRLEYPMRFYPGEKAREETDIPAKEPVHHAEGVWRICAENAETAAKEMRREGAMSEQEAAAANTEAMGISEKKPLTCMDIVIAHFEKIILENYAKILNRQMVAELVERVHSRFPAVTEGVVPERVSLAGLQRVIADLIGERIPVNRLDYIISFLEEHPGENAKELEELKAELRG